MLAVLPHVGCAETVAVDVELGACTESMFSSLGSLDAVLKRQDGASWLPPCVATGEPVTSTDQLTALLSGSFSFREVPSGGVWTLAIKGFSDAACERAVFCGRTSGFSLPPSGRLLVRINCPPTYSEIEDYKACVRE